MDIARTPESHFANLSGYDFAPNYAFIKAQDGTELRLHYLDEGPRDGAPILCMHGQPSWSYLYRKMIPLLTAAGYRVIAPDLIGFGKSDKPTNRSDYTYAGHVDWMSQWLGSLDLGALTLVCQDWGGLIGLRLVAAFPERFDRLVIANTALPNSDAISEDASNALAQLYPTVPVPSANDVTEAFASGAPGAFLYWVKYCSEATDFSVRDVFGLLSNIQEDAVLDGYNAPFPGEAYMAGARQFPSLVPLMPHHKADREANDAAWAVLEKFDKPVLTAFSNNDPVTKGGEAAFQKRISGAQGISHVTIEGGGHFLQEGQPVALSNAIIDFMQATA